MNWRNNSARNTKARSYGPRARRELCEASDLSACTVRDHVFAGLSLCLEVLCCFAEPAQRVPRASSILAAARFGNGGNTDYSVDGGEPTGATGARGLGCLPAVGATVCGARGRAAPAPPRQESSIWGKNEVRMPPSSPVMSPSGSMRSPHSPVARLGLPPRPVRPERQPLPAPDSPDHSCSGLYPCWGSIRINA